MFLYPCSSLIHDLSSMIPLPCSFYHAPLTSMLLLPCSSSIIMFLLPYSSFITMLLCHPDPSSMFLFHPWFLFHVPLSSMLSFIHDSSSMFPFHLHVPMSWPFLYPISYFHYILYLYLISLTVGVLYGRLHFGRTVTHSASYMMHYDAQCDSGALADF